MANIVADVVDKETRSRIMSAIRSKNTKLEKGFRKLLWSNGLGRYRLYYKLPGKPDIVYVAKRVAVFVDGDFWHGYGWSKLVRRLSSPYWKKKIKTNMERDKRINVQLRATGWKVIRFWEHDVKMKPKKCVRRLRKVLAV